VTPERMTEIEAEELARIEIRQRLDAEKRSARWGKGLLGVSAMIAMLVGCPPVLYILTSGSAATNIGQQETDQLLMILKIAGPPDSSKSTEFDSPPPPIPSRILHYGSAGVRVAFLREPGKNWRLLGFMDAASGEALSDVTALARLRQAKR
jgi:hypothetical protein